MADLFATVFDQPLAVATYLLATLVAGVVVFFNWPDSEAAITYTVPVPEQCKPGWRGKVLDEPSIKVPGSSAVQCYCPATGESLGLVNPSTPDGIDRVITRAQDAQLEWAKTTFAQRRQVLKTLLKYVLEHQDGIVTAACLDSGKTRVDALFGEVLVTTEKLKWTIDHGEKALRPERRPTNLLMLYKKNTVRYEPLGVVAACVSWNYPFHNLIGPVISSLFTGNAIVVKTSENTAWSSVFFTSIIQGALVACGHSPHLVASITCWPQTASHLTSHPSISHLTFIGSRPVAHAVCTSAAKSLTPVLVELGGKDPAIILPNTLSNLATTASVLLRGIFQSSGQNCIGLERIIALPQAYDALLDIFTARIPTIRQGSPLHDPDADLGALVSAAAIPRLEALVADAVARGATLVHGGARHSNPAWPAGHYFAPTLLAGVTPDMPIARDECFGPIALLMRAASAADAVAIANGTQYGLGASVFGPVTTAAQRAEIDTCVRALKAGMVAVNDFAVTYVVQLPFGGTKGSGYGRFAGEEGLRGLCNLKAVCEDRFGGWVRTTIPPELDYPLSRRGPVVGKGVVELGYGETLGRRVGGLRKILGV